MRRLEKACEKSKEEEEERKTSGFCLNRGAQKTRSAKAEGANEKGRRKCETEIERKREK